MSGVDETGRWEAVGEKVQSFLRLPEGWAEGRPWLGWLLVGGLALALLSAVAFVGFGLVIVWLVARHGAGEMGHGLPYALWWIFGLLAVVPLSFFRLWWHFSRGSAPQRGPRELKAAERGDPRAAYQMACRYRGGDDLSARAWMLQAAQAGVPEAMVDLATLLREGRGGPRDLQAARAWLARATDAGEPRARALLAEVEARVGDRFGGGAGTD